LLPERKASSKSTSTWFLNTPTTVPDKPKGTARVHANSTGQRRRRRNTGAQAGSPAKGTGETGGREGDHTTGARGADVHHTVPNIQRRGLLCTAPVMSVTLPTEKKKETSPWSRSRGGGARATRTFACVGRLDGGRISLGCTVSNVMGSSNSCFPSTTLSCSWAGGAPSAARDPVLHSLRRQPLRELPVA
jgi:hypothetical protein